MSASPAAPAPVAPRRRLLFSVVILAALLLVAIAGLGITELVMRSSRSSSVYREVQRHPPHPVLQAVPAMAAGHVNRQGFRGDDFEKQKPPRTFRIFTLGGSTTLGVSNDYPDTYPYLLQVALRERYPGVNIEVQNAGCAWYTSAHARVADGTAVRQSDPDLSRPSTISCGASRRRGWRPDRSSPITRITSARMRACWVPSLIFSIRRVHY